MEKDLKEIRNPNKSLKMKNKIINTFLIFLFGVVLGIFSKWLDNLSIDDSVWWQHILETPFFIIFSSQITIHLFHLYLNIGLFLLLLVIYLSVLLVVVLSIHKLKHL